MMQLSVGTLRSMTLEELKQATEWAVRFAAMAGPDEPTARRVLLRLAEALCDEVSRLLKLDAYAFNAVKYGYKAASIR